PVSFARTLRDDFGIHDVQAMKVCLTLRQVRERNLPPNFHLEEKKEGARYDAFVEKDGKGQSVYELEALPSEERSRLLEEAILPIIDVVAFNHELEREERDAPALEELRRRVIESMADLLGPDDGEFPDKSGFRSARGTRRRRGGRS